MEDSGGVQASCADRGSGGGDSGALASPLGARWYATSFMLTSNLAMLLGSAEEDLAQTSDESVTRLVIPAGSGQYVSPEHFRIFPLGDDFYVGFDISVVSISVCPAAGPGSRQQLRYNGGRLAL